MINEQTIQNLIDEKLSGTDVFLVEFRVKTDNKIRVFIDSERGITIDDCVALSRHIEGNLDREQEDFGLDVSSAGLDLPLRVPRQFKKNVGRTVHVIMNDGIEIKGKLTEATDEDFQVLPEIKKKKKASTLRQAQCPTAKIMETDEIQPVSINYIDQKSTKIVLIF
ncbi:MAG: ribosome assembly cofactor RimP [Bacteroidales bacterium]|nr:ribosome assembly cofactor RimP [Bacteroidales bacterium]